MTINFLIKTFLVDIEYYLLSILKILIYKLCYIPILLMTHTNLFLILVKELNDVAVYKNHYF